MLISRFNRVFARHGKWLIGSLAVIIALSMVVFVTPGRRGGSGREEKKLIGEIFGRKLEREEFFEHLYAADIATYLRWGQLPSQNSRLFGFLVEETLKRMRALREAEARGLLAVSDKDVAEAIRDVRVFQDGDGKFDREKFDQFSENTLKRREIDGRRFDRIVRENLAIERLEEQVRSAVFVSPAEVRSAFDRDNEKFKVQYVEFRLDDYKKDVDAGPLDPEIEAYFAEHKAELKLPDEKRIRVAVFTADAYADKAVVTDKEVRQHFERTRKHLYDAKKKTFADVQDEIAQQLRKNRARRLATEQAKKLCKELSANKGKFGDQKPSEVFAAVCKQLGVNVKDSGPFHNDSKEIPEIGASSRLRQKACELTPEEPFTKNAIYDGGEHYVASLLEALPGKAPTELTDWVRGDIRERILSEKAEAFFEEHVAGYREAVAGGKTVAAVREEESSKIDSLEDKTDEEKAQLKRAASRAIDTFLVPFHVPEQRKLRVAAFSPGTYRAKVTLSEDDIKAYYDAHPEEYQQPEVRIRQIVLRVPAKATPVQKQAKRKAMAGILAEIKGGAAFASVARKKSQDPLSKRRGGDAGYWKRGQKEKALEDAAFALEKGAISGVIEASNALYILKEEGRRDGRPLAEVKVQIRSKLTGEKAKEFATQGAEAFAKAVKAKLANSGSLVANAKLFGEIADEQKVTLKETELFGRSGTILPLGSEPALSKAAFALSASAPATDLVAGRRNTFVACLLEIASPHVPTFAQDPELAKKIRALMRKEEARKFYEEKVEIYRDQITAGKTPDQLKEDHAEEVRGMDELSDEEREQRIKDYDQLINDYLRPYFVPLQKKARVVTLAPSAFRRLTKVTEEDIKAHYEDNRDKYDREEVRGRQIMVRVPYDASEEVKSTKRAQAEALFEKLRGGEDFEAVVRSDSEDYATKTKGGDLGFFGRGDKAPDIEEALFGLEVGEVSSVVESANAFYLFRLEERRNGRSIEQVSGEIRNELLGKESERLAEDAAYEFSEKAYKALEAAGGDAKAAAVFKATALAAGLSFKDTQLHRGRGSIPPFGFESTLSRETYKLDESDPLSESIKGKEDFYVACWLESKVAYLSSFDDEPGLSTRIERHVTRDKALREATAKGKLAHEAIAKKLADGASTTDVLAEFDFKESDEFTASRPPSGLPNRTEVAEAVTKHNAGELLEVFEGRTGMTVVFVSERKPATDDEFEEGRERYEGQVKRTKEGERLRSFYKRLEDESGTVLEEEWQARS